MHYILGFSIFLGRQTVEKRAWPLKKKSKKSKKSKIKVGEVGNMSLMVCTVANRYKKANYTCTAIVHHIMGENFNVFLLLGLVGLF